MYLASLPSSSWIPHLFSQGFYSQPLKRSPSAFTPLLPDWYLALTPFFSLSKLIYLGIYTLFLDFSPSFASWAHVSVSSHECVVTFSEALKTEESRALLPSQGLYFSTFSTYPLMSKWAEWLLLMKEMWAGEFLKIQVIKKQKRLPPSLFHHLPGAERKMCVVREGPGLLNDHVQAIPPVHFQESAYTVMMPDWPLTHLSSFLTSVLPCVRSLSPIFLLFLLDY